MRKILRRDKKRPSLTRLQTKGRPESFKLSSKSTRTTPVTTVKVKYKAGYLYQKVEKIRVDEASWVRSRTRKVLTTVVYITKQHQCPFIQKGIFCCLPWWPYKRFQSEGTLQDFVADHDDRQRKNAEFLGFGPACRLKTAKAKLCLDAEIRPRSWCLRFISSSI